MPPAQLVLELAVMAGFLGAVAWSLCCTFAASVARWLVHRFDKQQRIQDARWRARWQGFLTEAKEQGLQGRDAVLWAANAMRVHRHTLAQLAGPGDA